MIVIVNFGMGNLHSVYNQCRKMGYDIIVSSNINDISNASKIILPGVGHFSKAMEKLKELNFISTLNKKVLEDKTPILGICLGMQLLGLRSDEGDINGLGWIDAETKKFKLYDRKYKIPHMGWNSLIIQNSATILKGIAEDDEFYFVHSYYMKTKLKDIVLSETEYGIKFVSAINKDNIFGTQFHPEKSHDIGIKILKNFISL